MRTEKYTLLLLAALCIQTVFSQSIPLDHPVYEPLNRLAAEGLLPALSGHSLPYRRDAVLLALRHVDTLRCSGRQRLDCEEALTLLQPPVLGTGENRLLIDLHLSGTAGYLDTAAYQTRGLLGVAYVFGRFTLANRVSADYSSEERRFDHLDRQFKKSVPTDMPQAYLMYTGDHFGLSLGRDKVKWGPGRFGNLLLSDHQPALNRVFAWAELGFLKGYAVAAKLAPAGSISRHFAASRLVVNVTEKLTLALNQSIVYAGLHRNTELFYAVPSFIYYFSQFGFTSLNETENVFVGADGERRFAKNARAYFEFLADDFQVDRDISSRTTQNGVAFLMGLDFPESGSRPGLGAEFTHVNSYVYKHMGGLQTGYWANLHGGVLGHALGPDAQQLNLWADHRFSRYFKGAMHYCLTRRGDLNDVYAVWDAYHKADDPIPHGVVEDAQQITAQAGLVNWRGFCASLDLGYSRLANVNHTDSASSGPVVRLSVDYCLGRELQWKMRETAVEKR